MVQIKVNDSSLVATIDIEGVIGVPEKMQFGDSGGSDSRVATYAGFTSSLAQIERVEAKEIIVNIRSAGGDVNDALLIYDALCGLDARIITRCYGYVASAATIIAQAASEGCREISSNALYLIHCSESMVEGNARSLAITKDLLDKTDERIAAIYAARSGRGVEDYTAMMNENGGKGRWIEASEAVEAGLADEIIHVAVRNDADRIAEDEFIGLCRLLGLAPPDELLTKEESGGIESKRGRVRLRTLWRTLLKLFGQQGDDAANAGMQGGQSGGAEPQNILESKVDESDSSQQNAQAQEQGLDRQIKDGSLSEHSDERESPDAESRRRAEVKPSAADLPVDKVVVIEYHDLQANALPTTTRPVEDPSVEEYELSPNQAAYEQDALSLKRKA